MSSALFFSIIGGLGILLISMLDTMPTLDYSQTYSCPLCLRGEIRAFPLMDAFGCDFCRHIFSANLEEQILDLADGQVPRRWYRKGHQWITKDQEVFWGYGLFGLILIILPTAIVGLGAYCFPPLPNSPLSWLPKLWVVLTLIFHLIFLSWLAALYFQFPFRSYFRLLQERFHLINFREDNNR